MAKLYFRYGAMGSSKTANAVMVRYNYMERGCKVLMLKPEHISAYSLILEPGTPFYDEYSTKEGQAELPDEDSEREMYALTKALLSQHGYHRYEISNYARPGFECRHNIGYWTGAEYLGVGLGASSMMVNHRFHSETDLQKYLEVRMHEDLTPLFQDVEALFPWRTAWRSSCTLGSA